jgi:pimeloyl-ACP methyl ester carboxylesterase
VDALALADDVIASLPHETLIVHGRDDRVIPLATSLRLLDLLDRARLHVFARCGHWVQIEHGARFAALVEGFLAESGAAAG